jgi:hypothetical protein
VRWGARGDGWRQLDDLDAIAPEAGAEEIAVERTRAFDVSRSKYVAAKTGHEGPIHEPSSRSRPGYGSAQGNAANAIAPPKTALISIVLTIPQRHPRGVTRQILV